MKKTLLLLLILTLVPPVLAFKGVGISYGATTLEVDENKITCLNYGVYNPWDENVTVSIAAGGELTGLLESQEEIFVPAKTNHDKAIPFKACFRIGAVYPKDCFLGVLACEKKCPEDLVRFSGSVIVTEAVPKGVAGSGSRARISASAPLDLIVRCQPQKRNWVPVIALGLALIVALVAGLWLLKRRF